MNGLDGFWLLLYAAIILLVGRQLVALLYRGQPIPTEQRIELIGLSVAVGAGIVPWLMLMLSMLGHAPTRGPILLLGGLAALSVIRLRLRFSAATLPRTKLGGYVMPAFALLLVQAALLIGQSLVPTYELDAVAIWGLKAKILFTDPLRPTPDYFSNLSLSLTHLDYPLLVPMLWVGGFAMQGHADETTSKLILLLPTLSIALMVYGFAARKAGRSIAWVLTALAIGSAATTRWAAQGLADQTLAMFIGAAAVALFRFAEDDRVGDALLLGTFAAFAALTKLEGGVLLALVSLAILVGSIRRRRLLLGVLCVVVFYTPWWLWARQLPHTHENYGERLSPANLLAHLNHIPFVLRALRSSFQPLTWWPILLLLLASAATNLRPLRRPAVIAAWLILLIHLAADFAAYLVSPWDAATPNGTQVLVGFTFDRLLLQLTPLVVLLIAVHWPSDLPNSRRDAPFPRTRGRGPG